MFKKIFDCGVCNEQFLRNEWRWKRITIPVFIVIATFTVSDYPILWDLFPYHFINITAVIIALWVINRYIIISFQRHYGSHKSRKRIFLFKYLLTVFASVAIVFIDITIFHQILIIIAPEKCIDLTFVNILLQHRYLFLITTLFAYFINANYERLFLFIELTETAIMAEKYKKDSIESRFNNLKNKINPHFLFNTFNALSEIIEEDPPKASKLVNELSDVYRYVLDNQDVNWIPLKKEIDFVYAYINLFKMRFEDNLISDINIPAAYLDYQIAPLTLQLLIENAIKHNEISSKKPLKIQIEVKDASIVVKNNLQLKYIINSGSSFGLKNLKERYKHLTNNLIDISQTENEFIVRIPLIWEIKENKAGKNLKFHKNEKLN
ncbi:MAG: histidine kinase [Bacteroidales bacterium]|nr:histidine kinase [Bacteroidales bacterium]